MKLQRLENLYIRQLELLFSPPGLPLVAKADPKGAPTTTILIRGEAGAGKTTLALALAHAIARARKGVLIVLNTETAPVEVDAKAAFLGISSRQVLAWPARGKARKGSIVVQHIALAAGPDEFDAGNEPAPRPGILDALWEMLRTYRDESPDRPPIVAVMIDGMLLTEREETTGPTRSDTAAFLQALETRGISTVMIEESAPKQTSWLPFVVDLVFELQFNIADDTHKLVRQLVCRKSRYTPAFAGPHEYDLDEDNVLAVWPDPLDIDPEILREISGTDERETSVFWPLNEEDSCWIWRGAGLLCASIGSKWDIVRAMSTDPSSVSLMIDLDEQGINDSDDFIYPTSRGGVYAIFWNTLRVARVRQRSTIAIHELDRLITFAQSQTLFLRALRGLLRSGFLVGVRGHEDELKKIRPFSTFSENFFKLAGKVKITKRETLTAERWCIDILPLATLTNDERSELLHALARHPETGSIEQLIQNPRLPITPAELRKRLDSIEALAAKYTKSKQHFSCAFSLFALDCIHRLRLSGASNTGSAAIFASLAETDPRVGTFCALHFYLNGDDWRAARAVVNANAGEQLLARVLWTSFCTYHVAVDPASETLRHIAADLSYPMDVRRLAASSLARIQYLRGTATDARSCIDAVANGLDPWLIERWHAEVAFESSDETILATAATTLHALAMDPVVPAIHQAEILYNLALLAERQQRPADALALCARAQERNPAQEPTFQRLRTRLQSPAKPALA